MFTPVKQYPRDNRHSMSYNKHVRNAKRVRSRRNSDRKTLETAAFLRSHGKAQNAAACDNDNRESLSIKFKALSLQIYAVRFRLIGQAKNTSR